MALKKRGFNVDRILNQQREERLRVQAEETARQREAREKQATLAPLPAAGPPVYDDTSDATSTTAIDDESISSVGSKKNSLLDRLRRQSKDMKGQGGHESPTPTMPGGLAGFGKGKFGSGLSGLGGAFGGGTGQGASGSGGSGSGGGGGSGPINPQATKRVSGGLRECGAC